MLKFELTHDISPKLQQHSANIMLSILEDNPLEAHYDWQDEEDSCTYSGSSVTQRLLINHFTLDFSKKYALI